MLRLKTVKSIFQRFQWTKRLGGRISLNPSPFGSKATIQYCWVSGVEGRKKKEGQKGLKYVDEGFKLEADIELGNYDFTRCVQGKACWAEGTA